MSHPYQPPRSKELNAGTTSTLDGRVYGALALVYAIVLAAALLVTGANDGQRSGVSFVLAAIAASFAGILAAKKYGLEALTSGAKARLGLGLVVIAAACAIVTDSFLAMSAYPEVTIPIAALGSGLFPFAVGGSFWKALVRPKPN